MNSGDVGPAQRSTRSDSRKLDDQHELFILTLISENPTLYLKNICLMISKTTNVTVSASTVCRVIRFTRKKLTQIAKQRCTFYRGDFMD